MANQTSSDSKSFKQSRRKLLLASAKVAPVVTAMAAAPVWATSGSNGSNQSPGMSAATKQAVKFNGFSPGYFKRKKTTHHKRRYSSYSQTPSTQSQSDSSVQCENVGNNRLPERYYEMYYGGVGGVFPFSRLNAKVADVLDPSRWRRTGQHITQIDRFMLTAYFNADPTYGALGYPYTQQEVVRFAEDYERGLISDSDAYTILVNLIHEGQADLGWEADTVC